MRHKKANGRGFRVRSYESGRVVIVFACSHKLWLALLSAVVTLTLTWWRLTLPQPKEVHDGGRIEAGSDTRDENKILGPLE
jgi:hypothetical protein